MPEVGVREAATLVYRLTGITKTRVPTGQEKKLSKQVVLKSQENLILVRKQYNMKKVRKNDITFLDKYNLPQIMAAFCPV